MSSTKKTCGPMYKEALGLYAGNDPEKIRLFAAGFVSGQAEKVYLGACIGAMFRPSEDRSEMLMEVVFDVAGRYGLRILGGFGAKDEIWICRPENASAFDALAIVAVDSPAWHAIRGMICGVKPNDIDYEFHARKGYGERCD